MPSPDLDQEVGTNSEPSTPPSLLRAYLTEYQNHQRALLPIAAARSRSVEARKLVAAAIGDGVTPHLAVEAARGDGSARRKLLKSRPDPRPISWLSRVVYVQGLHPDDHEVALSLANLALEVGGPHAVTPDYQRLHLELATEAERHEWASELMRRYRDVPAEGRSVVEADLANPFLGGPYSNEEQWCRHLAGFFPEGELRCRTPMDAQPFEGIEVDAPSGSVGGRLVTVVVTCFKPGQPLITALRSLVAQTWGDLEILLVDDGTPPGFSDRLDAARELDPRVRLVRCKVNRGTYSARNVGINEARGELVTFLDSDDWSHPRRIEEQVQVLLRDPGLIAVQSDLLDAGENLRLSFAGRPVQYANASSLMFRKEQVLDRIGLFDSVRKAADNEFIRRMQIAFGDDRIARLTGKAHILRRLSDSSLSHAEFRGGWVHPTRNAYWSGYHHWHERIRVGRSNPYLPSHDQSRPFQAPRSFLAAQGVATRKSTIDVLYCADWRELDEVQRGALEEIAILRRDGFRVGILHLESLWRAGNRERWLSEPVQELLDRGLIEQVFLDQEEDVGLIVVRQPEVIQFPPYGDVSLSVRQVVIVAEEGPTLSDGRGPMYEPDDCTQAAMGLFDADPVWVSASESAAGAVAERPSEERLDAPFPKVVDVAAWGAARSEPRATRPVVGFHGRSDSFELPSKRDRMLIAYPDSDAVDIRLMCAASYLRSVIGQSSLPANWLVFPPGRFESRDFVSQLDFWVAFPSRGEPRIGRPLLEALADGCVVVLPEAYRELLGDAAVYCQPEELLTTIDALHANPDSYLAQSRLAREWVASRSDPDAFVGMIRPLAGRDDDGRGEASVPTSGLEGHRG